MRESERERERTRANEREQEARKGSVDDRRCFENSNFPELT